MGANQSTPSTPKPTPIPSGAKVAFNVLKVAPNSPAARAQFIPYFDYIVSVNGVTVIQEMPNVVAEMAKSHVDKVLRMMVYNARNDTVREVRITPSLSWGGDGLLGCAIRFTTYERAIDRVWRVLDSTPDSPGFKAGLIPLKDWIIGSVDLALRSEDDFYQLLIHNVKKQVKLIVFNIERNSCREVTVVPDFDWGGEGCLGCDIGMGMLNRIPIDPHGIISSEGDRDRDSLLAGQGVLRNAESVDNKRAVVTPGRPTPLLYSVEPESFESHVQQGAVTSEQAFVNATRAHDEQATSPAQHEVSLKPEHRECDQLLEAVPGVIQKLSIESENEKNDIASDSEGNVQGIEELRACEQPLVTEQTENTDLSPMRSAQPDEDITGHSAERASQYAAKSFEGHAAEIFERNDGHKQSPTAGIHPLFAQSSNNDEPENLFQ